MSRALAIILVCLASLVLLTPATLAGEPRSPAATAPPKTATPAKTSVLGVLRKEDGPVVGAVVVVTDAHGNKVGESKSGPDGRWKIPLPGPGTYLVTLRTDTLTEGAELAEPNRQTLQVRVFEGEKQGVIFPLGKREAASARVLGQLAQVLLNGVKFGLIIATTAIGLSLIFGTTGLINFAHGELVTFGAIIAWYLNAQGPALHLIPAAALATVIAGFFSGALEYGLFRPLRARRVGLFQLLVITIGLALVIRHLLLIFFGGRSAPYADYTIQRVITLGRVATTPRDAVVMVLSVLVLLGVATLLQRTRTGKAMRAVADNPVLAKSSGVDVPRVILMVWVCGGALAAVGGIFLGLVETVNYLMGFRLLLLMFAGVILGGLGTAYGAMVGSFVIGIITELSTLWFASELKFVWALAVLVLVLLVKPQGILGRPERIG
ncbi:MAG: branched-chain amino acid ABC transporter permease [Actinomycetota bacterium]|nr:branched-chain amino acid ABC transporter permease [Actinomycetota bacterium]